MKTKILKNAAILLVLASEFVSCQKDRHAVTSTLIGKGQLCGMEGILKQNKVIQTPEEWEDLKTVINSVNDVTNSFSETEIDFSTYQLIAVFDEVRPDGGWDTYIAHITEYSDKLVVMVKNTRSHGPVPSVIIQPYHIVKISKSTKQVEFRYF